MKHLKWIERKFDFGYTVEYLPLFLERLKSTAPRIEEIVKGSSEAELSHMPNGKWSIKQHIGHLTDLEELHNARLHDYRAGKDVLRPADMKNVKTEEADHNKRSVGELISELRKTRADFIEHLLSFSEEELMKKAMHPRLQQQVSVIDLLHFIAEHDLFHVVHMERCLDPEL